jgi:hypothetical protein
MRGASGFALPGAHGRGSRPSRICRRSQDREGDPFRIAMGQDTAQAPTSPFFQAPDWLVAIWSPRKSRRTYLFRTILNLLVPVRGFEPLTY